MPALLAASISGPPGRRMSEARISGWRPGSCVEFGEVAEGALWPKRPARPPAGVTPGVGVGRGGAARADRRDQAVADDDRPALDRGAGDGDDARARDGVDARGADRLR